MSKDYFNSFWQIPPSMFLPSRGRFKSRIPKCTCHPADGRPDPCPRKFALRECWRAAVLKETQDGIVVLKNQDRTEMEQGLLNYLMRVRAALEHEGNQC